MHGVHGDALRLLELLAVRRRRVHVDPADAEADARAAAAGRRASAGSTRRRGRSRSRSSRSPSTNSSRIASPVGDATSASCRCASMSSSDSTRKTPRWPPESAGLSTAGNPTSSAARRVSAIDRTAAKRGCGTPASASRVRIAILCVIRCAVSTPIPGSPRASAIAATTGTARSALTRHHAVELDPGRRLEHRADVGEVDDLRDVRLGEPGRVGVAVDRDHAQAELLGLEDRPALVAPCADEEDGLHAGRMLLRRQRRPDELECPLDVDRIAGAEVHGESVEHDAEEAADRLQIEIVTLEPVRPPLEQLFARAAPAGRGCAPAIACGAPGSCAGGGRPRGRRPPTRDPRRRSGARRPRTPGRARARRSPAGPPWRARRRAPTWSGSS